MTHLFPTSPTRSDPVEACLGFNVWLVSQDRSREQRAGYVQKVYHTQKMPPELARRMIEHARLVPWSVVGDCFAGTCTTGVEAIRMGHRFVGVEIEPDYIEQNGVPNLRAAGGVRGAYDVWQGDAAYMPWIPDESINLWVCSPPYGDTDPSRDSGGRTLHERHHRGEEYASYVGRTSALGKAVLKHGENAMGAMKLPEWSAKMLAVLREMRRCTVPGGFASIALREYWDDSGMVDLGGIVIAMAPEAGWIRHDQIYALECSVDRFGQLTTRASLHQNRLAKKQLAEGKPCPRGVPAVTRVVILRRRERK